MEHQHFEDPAELIRKYKENITIKRTLEKKDFDTWKAGILACSDDFRAKLPYDVTTLTHEEMYSQLYEDWPDRDLYEQQYAEAYKKIMEINEIVNDLNKQALEYLKQSAQLENKQ